MTHPNCQLINILYKVYNLIIMTDFLVQQCGVEICKKFECKAFVLIVFSLIEQECFLQIIKVQQISIVLSEYYLFIDKSLKI